LSISHEPRKRPAWLPLVIGAGVLAGAMLLSSQPDQTPDGVKILRSIEERDAAMLRVRDLTSAQLQAVDSGIKLTPTDREKLKQGLQEVRAVADFEPRATAPFLVAGRIADAIEDPLLAERFYRQACANVDQDRDPEQRKVNYLDGAEAGYRLCDILLARRQAKEAKPFADDIVRVVPNAPHYRVARAEVLFQLGDVKGARAELTEALKLDPKLPRARLFSSFMKGAE
jgi:tetratricopeptide (TPR) repeat protein